MPRAAAAPDAELLADRARRRRALANVRKRRHRHRERDGLKRIAFDVEEVAAANWLLDHGHCTEADLLRSDGLSEALGRVVRQMIGARR